MALKKEAPLSDGAITCLLRLQKSTLTKRWSPVMALIMRKESYWCSALLPVHSLYTLITYHPYLEQILHLFPIYYAYIRLTIVLKSFLWWLPYTYIHFGVDMYPLFILFNLVKLLHTNEGNISKCIYCVWSNKVDTPI